MRVGRSPAVVLGSILLGGALGASSAQASPSDVSSPRVSNQSKIKLTLERKSDEANVSWSLPKISYSAAVADVGEIEVAYIHVRARRGGGAYRSGPNQIEVKAKLALERRDRGGAFDLAIEPKVVLPLGDEGERLSSSPVQLELPLLLGREYGRVGVFGELGYKHEFGGEGVADKILGGALVTYQLTPSLTLGTDVFVEIPLKRRHSHKISTNIGLNWRINPAVELQLLAGHSFRARIFDSPLIKAKLVLEL